MPLSSFVFPGSDFEGAGMGGGRLRSETGRRVDAAGKKEGTNCTVERAWSLAGEGGGGSGGGSGGGGGGRGGGGGGRLVTGGGEDSGVR